MTKTLLQTDLGPIWYPAGDVGVTEQVARDGVWEQAEADTLRSLLKPGDSFLDVGAHVGYFSVLAAQLVGPEGSVIALEPVEANVDLLAANLEPYPQCVMLPVAAWNHFGTLEIHRSQSNSGDNRAGSKPPDCSETLKVMAMPVDDLNLNNVKVIKIDTQGSDHIVVTGAMRTIARCRPTLVVEYWPEGILLSGANPTSVLGLYADLGYKITPLNEDGLIPETNYCSLLLEPIL